MKKNFMKTALVAVFCCAVGYTAYNAQNKNNNLSEVMLNNVEALAKYENSSGYFVVTAYGETTHTDNGNSVTSYTPYTTTCPTGGNRSCTPGSGTECVTIKKG